MAEAAAASKQEFIASINQRTTAHSSTAVTRGGVTTCCPAPPPYDETRRTVDTEILSHGRHYECGAAIGCSRHSTASHRRGPCTGLRVATSHGPSVLAEKTGKRAAIERNRQNVEMSKRPALKNVTILLSLVIFHMVTAVSYLSQWWMSSERKTQKYLTVWTWFMVHGTICP